MPNPPQPPDPSPAATADSLPIAGLVRLSTTDWPDQLVATVFLQGCPWRCPYCHNPDLLPIGRPGCLPWAEVEAFLGQRRGLLDGVVFSGGEPTIHPGLGAAMAAVRRLGLGVGLHTAGPVPAALTALHPHLDWVGFDVKAPFSEYAALTGRADSGARARDSLTGLLAATGLAVEVRTTLHGALIDADGLDRLAGELIDLGVGHWVMQAFRPQGCADPDWIARGLRHPPPQLSPTRAAAFARLEQRSA